MNLTISRSALLKLTSRILPAVSRKAPLPILANVSLRATDDALHAVATDTYTSISTHGPAQVATPGAICLPARDLHDRVAAMPDGDITLSVDKHIATVKAAKAKRQFTLRTTPASEFPQVAGPTDALAELTLPGPTLATVIGQVYPSISTDETRPHVNSALLELSKNCLRMVSTDGHRLAMANAPVTYDGVEVKALWPRTVAHEVARLCDDGDIAVHLSLTSAWFRVGETVLGARLVDAQFPPYKQVIPKHDGRPARMSRAALIDALKAVRVIVDPKVGSVKLTFSGDVLRIEGNHPDTGSGVDEVACEYGGAARTIGVNAGYMLDELGCIKADEVELVFGTELDPVLVRGAGDERFLAVVMPMKV